MEEAVAGWEEGVRDRFSARWIGQLGVMAGEIRKAGVFDIVDRKETPAQLLEGIESMQARGVLTKEQWLQKRHQEKSLNWDLCAAKNTQAQEDS